MNLLTLLKMDGVKGPIPSKDPMCKRKDLGQTDYFLIDVVDKKKYYPANLQDSFSKGE